MGHHDHRRGWTPPGDDAGFENPFARRERHREHDQRGGHGSRGEWGPPWARQDGRGRGGRGGPPPWIAGLFGPPDAGRGPRVRRGDVRVAILDVLRAAGAAGEPINGYQVIQQIAERSNDAWRPSPGSVYPTIQQLQDEGLVEADDDKGRKTLRLTTTGTSYVEDNADELAGVWAPFDRPERSVEDRVDLKPEIGQMMSAVWQIVSAGSEAQRRAAVDILVDTRRRLYGVLADGDEPEAREGRDDGAE